MSQASLDEEVFTFDVEDMDWEIPCDIGKLGLGVPGYPMCMGEPAQWIGLRANCCPQGPRYRLVCDHCKSVYQRWQARQASIVCGICGAETGGFLDFVPLRKS